MGSKKEGEKDIVIKGASLVLLFVSFVFACVPYLVPYLLNFLFDDTIQLTNDNLFKITAFSVGITLLFALALFCIGTMKQFRGLILRDNMEELNKITNQLKQSSDSIADNVLSENNIVIESYIINDISTFFNKLIEVREKVQKNRNIRLMSFALNPNEEEYKDKDGVKTYYNSELLFCNENKDMAVYKIVSIHTEKKLISCQNLVRKAEEMKLRNFNLAYLKLNKFGNHPPEIIGLDIIGDVVFLMNPEYARITSESDWVSLYIKSPSVSEIYRNYHKALWKTIKHDASKKCGLILYEGEGGGTSPRIEEYWAKIKEQINEDSKEQTPSTVADNKDSSDKKKTALFESLKAYAKFLSKKGQ